MEIVERYGILTKCWYSVLMSREIFEPILVMLAVVKPVLKSRVKRVSSNSEYVRNNFHFLEPYRCSGESPTSSRSTANYIIRLREKCCGRMRKDLH
jgi:hypothetical protein